jgi:hypothetical protein
MHVGLQNCMSRAIKCMFETHNACSITNAGASAPLVQFTSPGTPGHTISRALNTSKCVSVHPWLSSDFLYPGPAGPARAAGGPGTRSLSPASLSHGHRVC